MSFIETKLSEMGLTLPPPFVYPNKSRVGCVQVGNILFTSGHHPPEDYGVPLVGTIGDDVSDEVAYKAAHATGLNILSTVKQELGSLDRVKRVVKLLGMIKAVPGYDRQSLVIDGASDLLFELFGPEIGQHARSAVAMADLPRRGVVEIEAIFEVHE